MGTAAHQNNHVGGPACWVGAGRARWRAREKEGLPVSHAPSILISTPFWLRLCPHFLQLIPPYPTQSLSR